MKNIIENFLDFILVGSLSIILILVIYFVPFSPLRIALGLPFVLLFPGYCLIALLYPRKEDLSDLERLALSLGLSLALVPLLGLLLNFTPWGIRLTPMLIGLILLNSFLSGIAIYRRQTIHPQERFRISFEWVLPRWRALSISDKALTALLILAVLGLLGTIIYLIQSPRVGERFTEFYVLGPGGKAEDYPTELRVGKPVDLLVGIVNHEQKHVDYSVKALINGKKVGEVGPISLSHKQKWEGHIKVVPQEPGERQKLQLLLYKEGEIEPYLSLHLWVNIR